MPFDPSAQRLNNGNYERKKSVFASPLIHQRQLARMADAFGTQPPQRLNPVSLLLLLHTVSSGTSRVVAPAWPPTQADPNTCIAPGNFTTGIGNAVSQVTSPATLCASRTPASHLSGRQQMRYRQANKRCPPPAKDISPASSSTTRSDFFLWPMVAATSAALPTGAMQWDEEKQILTADSSDAKRIVIDYLKTHLQQTGAGGDDLTEQAELEWRQRSTDTPIIATALKKETVQAKPVSFTQHEKWDVQHITKNCAFEQEVIYDVNGKDKGKVLLFAAQIIENPFRAIYDHKYFNTSEFAAKLIDTGNVFYGMATLGIATTLGNLIADGLRFSYYYQHGDGVCSRRQARLFVAHLAMGLTFQGRAYKTDDRSLFSSDLVRHPVHKNRAAFYLRNTEMNIIKEVHLTVTVGSTERGTRTKIHLQPQDDETLVPVAATLQHADQRVIYNQQQHAWYFAKGAHRAPLNIKTQEEGTYLVHNEKLFELKINMPSQPDHPIEYMVRPFGSTTAFSPAFRNRLSQTWDLDNEHHSGFYKQRQNKLILKRRVAPDSNKHYRQIMNLHPQSYGIATIFEVRYPKQDIFKTAPLYCVIEMKGRLIPVKTVTLPKHGVRYDGYSLTNSRRTNKTLEWDGERWRFELATSEHISPWLKNAIKPEMYAAHTDREQLSAADQQGLLWSQNDRAYLKIKDHFVEVKQAASPYIEKPGGEMILLRYNNHMFELTEAKYGPQLPPSSAEQAGLDIPPLRPDQAVAALPAPDRPARPSAQAPAPDGITYNAVTEFIKANVPAAPSEVHVTQVPSADLTKKRFFLKVRGDIHFLESSDEDKSIAFLSGTNYTLALNKYLKKNPKDSIHQLSALKAKIKLGMLMDNQQNGADVLMKGQIAIGAYSIEEELTARKLRHQHGKIIVLGEANFLGTCTSADLATCTPELLYSQLMQKFFAISKNHPDAIIVPGTLQLTIYAPPNFQNREYIRERQNEQWVLDPWSKFSSKIAPVFFNGKLITIARKGEFLRYTLPTKTEVEAKLDAQMIYDLSDDLPIGTCFTTANEKIDSSDSIFVGKTLLPGEKALVQHLLAKHAPGQQGQNMTALFNNEFMIGDQKFLLILEDEFASDTEMSPSVRQRALSKTDNDDYDFVTCNRYDWILHSSEHGMLDPAMLSTSINYLQADVQKGSQFLSDNSVHKATVIDAASHHVRIYNYDNVESRT